MLSCRKIGYIRFLLRIKTRILNSKFLARLKLNAVIRKRKKLHFYKFKNSIRVVNWLLKFRRSKAIRNPFIKSRYKMRKRKNFNNISKNQRFLKFNKLSNKGKGFKVDYRKPAIAAPIKLIKPNVKGV